MINRHAFWVIHSPYPDGTWRGLEKTLGEDVGDGDGPMLFTDEGDAHKWRKSRGDGEYLKVVRVVLEVPSVRCGLDVVGGDSWGPS